MYFHRTPPDTGGIWGCSMKIHSYQNFKDRRADLRNDSTHEEYILWQYLRKRRLGFKFQRQHSIGPYVVDFYCAKRRLIIELDGNFHTEKFSKEYDTERTKYLESLNHIVIRFWNSEIRNNIEYVIQIILKDLNSLEP